MSSCAVQGCVRSHYAKGYCNPHWQRWKRNGSPGPGDVVVRHAHVTCTVDGCDRTHSAKGFCNTHYNQHRKGSEVVAITYRRTDPTARDAEGRKECPGCSTWKAEAEFHNKPAAPDGLTSWCKRCTSNRVYLTRYGITHDRYDEMLAEQGGGCAICHDVNPGGRALSVDHDHGCCPGPKSCGACVRKLLCGRCNAGIGLFQEDADRMYAAVEYIRAHARR